MAFWDKLQARDGKSRPDGTPKSRRKRKQPRPRKVTTIGVKFGKADEALRKAMKLEEEVREMGRQRRRESPIPLT